VQGDAARCLGLSSCHGRPGTHTPQVHSWPNRWDPFLTIMCCMLLLACAGVDQPGPGAGGGCGWQRPGGHPATRPAPGSTCGTASSSGRLHPYHFQCHGQHVRPIGQPPPQLEWGPDGQQQQQPMQWQKHPTGVGRHTVAQSSWCNTSVRGNNGSTSGTAITLSS
jgi:hypothetical protein